MPNDQPKNIIGCDIGGVVRDLGSGLIKDNAAAAIASIMERGDEIHFISKCKPAMEVTIKNWLQVHSLDHVSIHFCRDTGDKLEIGNELKINVMIDDKSVVLSAFPDTVRKIWFNPEKAKVDGAKKYQPDFLSSVNVVLSWWEVEGVVAGA